MSIDSIFTFNYKINFKLKYQILHRRSYNQSFILIFFKVIDLNKNIKRKYIFVSLKEKSRQIRNRFNLERI